MVKTVAIAAARQQWQYSGGSSREIERKSKKRREPQNVALCNLLARLKIWWSVDGCALLEFCLGPLSQFDDHRS